MNIKHLRDLCNFIMDKYGENVPMYMVITERGKIKQTDYIIDACKANGNNLLMLENYVAHHSVKKIELIKNIVKFLMAKTLVELK